MNESEGIFSGAGGIKLYYRAQRSPGAPFRGVLASVHDLPDDGPLSPALARGLLSQGYTLYSFARRELRRSAGQSGFVEEWDESLADLEAFLTLVRRREPDAPIFLAGRRVAAHLALDFALHNPGGLRGVIAIRPRQPAAEAHASLRSLTESLLRVWPGFGPPGISTAAAEPQPAHEDANQYTAEGPAVEPLPADLPIPLLLVRQDEPTGGVPARGGTSEPNEVDARIVNDIVSWLDEHR
jgi:alpha-beta hydrolase superfamily lysophospholipase